MKDIKNQSKPKPSEKNQEIDFFDEMIKAINHKNKKDKENKKK